MEDSYEWLRSSIKSYSLKEAWHKHHPAVGLRQRFDGPHIEGLTLDDKVIATTRECCKAAPGLSWAYFEVKVDDSPQDVTSKDVAIGFFIVPSMLDKISTAGYTLSNTGEVLHEKIPKQWCLGTWGKGDVVG